MPCFFFLTCHFENSELTLHVTAEVESVDLQLPLKQQLQPYGGNGNYLLQLLAKNLEEHLTVEDEDCDYIVLVVYSLENTWLKLKSRKC